MGQVGERVGQVRERVGQVRERGQSTLPTHIELSQTPRLPGSCASLQVVDVVEDGLLAKLVRHP